MSPPNHTANNSENHVVTLYPSLQPTLGFRGFRLMVETLLAQGVHVHCVSAGELKIDPHPKLSVYQNELPPRVKRRWYFTLLFALWAPFKVWEIRRRVRARSLVCSEPSLSALLVPVKILSRRPLITVLECAPWLARRAKTKARLRRGLGTVRDYLGLLSSTKILTVSDALAAEIKERVPFAAARVASLHREIIFPSALPREQNGPPNAEAWRVWLSGQAERRRKLAEDFQLPDKWLYVLAPSELIGRKNLEVLLRALSTLETERVVLIFCGQNTERNYLEAMAVGLGVYEQLLFADSLSVSEVLPACDLFILPATKPGNSQLLAEAIGSGTSVLASDIAENRELATDEGWRFTPENVQSLAEKLERVTTVKNQLEQLRRAVRETALKRGESWGGRLRDYAVG